MTSRTLPVNESRIDFQRRKDGLLTCTVKMLGWTVDDLSVALKALGCDDAVLRGLELVGRPRSTDAKGQDS